MAWYTWLLLAWVGVCVAFLAGTWWGSVAESNRQEERFEEICKVVMAETRKAAGQVCSNCGRPVGSAALAIGGAEAAEQLKYVCEWCGYIQAGEGPGEKEGATLAPKEAGQM